ncbi:MAG: hypothetical protein HFG39_04645 [Lachnospiraceae bacterium]|nr:hypothetical protein [Lachnospiraceae bacterium]
MLQQKEVILCVSNSYEMKYYLNPLFEKLPEAVKAELKIMCVFFSEEVGGIMILLFDKEGELKIKVKIADADVLFDEIECDLRIKELQQTKQELLNSISLYYKVLTGEITEEVLFGEE